MWNEWDLKLGEDPVPWMTVVNCLRSIGSNTITYENALALTKQTLLSEMQVNYVEDIFFTRDTENLGMLRKDMIHVISDIVQ